MIEQKYLLRSRLDVAADTPILVELRDVVVEYERDLAISTNYLALTLGTSIPLASKSVAKITFTLPVAMSIRIFCLDTLSMRPVIRAEASAFVDFEMSSATLFCEINTRGREATEFANIIAVLDSLASNVLRRACLLSELV